MLCLHQLVNVLGVAQADIGIGDPNSNFDKVTWDKCQPAFPSVKYWGSGGGGRTPAPQSAGRVYFASNGEYSDYRRRFI
jgi:hypothetical protein